MMIFVRIKKDSLFWKRVAYSPEVWRKFQSLFGDKYYGDIIPNNVWVGPVYDLSTFLFFLYSHSIIQHLSIPFIIQNTDDLLLFVG
jgi:hypothetical protein